MKAVIFCRTASMTGFTAEASMERQVSVCLKEAERLSFDVVFTLTLPGCAGRLAKVLEPLLSSVDEHDVDVVLVDTLDRLSRSPAETSAIIGTLQARDVTLVVVDEQLGFMPWAEDL